MMNKTINKYNIYILLSPVYLLLILYITMFSRHGSLVRTCRADLFWSYALWMEGNSDLGKEILLNIALFVPYGYFLSRALAALGEVIGQKSCNKIKFWILPLGIGLLTSAFIESVQYFYGLGLCETDDLFSNLLGTFLGICLYKGSRFVFSRGGLRCCKIALDVLLLAAGIAGCLMSGSSSKSSNHEDILHYDFAVTNLTYDGRIYDIQGICKVFGRDTPGYRVYLQGEESGKKYKGDTVVSGDTFHAVVPVDGTEKYKVNVLFDRFINLHTFTYVNKDRVEYVSGKVVLPETAGTDLEEIVNGGILKAYSSHYEVYVYQYRQMLYWLIGAPLDKGVSVVFLLFTNEPERLPENRIQYGFDNRWFMGGGKNELTRTMRCGRYRVFEREIPQEYNVTAVRTGLYRYKEKEFLWSGYFRVEKQ